MSTFWSAWIIGLTVTNLVLVTWVLFSNRKVAVSDDDDPENKTTGHVYDGIQEYDNPLPKWWFQMFVVTIIFAVIYLALYPGLGSWKGLLGWTSHNQLEREEEKAQEQYGAIFAEFAAMPVEEVADDPRALKMGLRIFANNCAVCHGADAGGNVGFPDLSDTDWLYGGSGAKIKETLTNGRIAAMPAWIDAMGEQGIKETVAYVLSLSGREMEENHDALAEAGKARFMACAACHGMDGKGNQMLGAPNLTDNIWLYGGSERAITETLTYGRNGVMPSFKKTLGDNKIHVVATYVYSLSN